MSYIDWETTRSDGPECVDDARGGISCAIEAVAGLLESTTTVSS